MFSQIIKDINNFNNVKSTFEISLFDQNLTQVMFQRIINKFVKDKKVWDEIQVNDSKEYRLDDLLLNIGANGVSIYYKKILTRSIKYENEQLNIYSIRQIDDFPGLLHYTDIYTQKKIMFSKDGLDFQFLIKTTEEKDKNTYYQIKIVLNSKSMYHKLNDFEKYLI